MRVAVGHDPGGERGTDPRKAVQFAHAGDVQVHEDIGPHSDACFGRRLPRDSDAP